MSPMRGSNRGAQCRLACGGCWRRPMICGVLISTRKLTTIVRNKHLAFHWSTVSSLPKPWLVARQTACDEAGTTVVSDGGQRFRCIAWQPGLIHERHVTGSDRAAARHPAFRWANTMLANVKNSLLATYRAVAAKHLPRYLGAFAWRFNRRFVLKTIHERLAIAAAATPPMPYRLLKLAEARW